MVALAASSDPLQHVKNDRFKEARRPKHVLFFPNGKPHYKPYQMRITPHKFNSFGDLLKDLTKNVRLPFGVRRVYTPSGGTEVDDLDDIADGSTYLCASFERFKPAKYASMDQLPAMAQSRPEWGMPASQSRPEVVYSNLGYTPNSMQLPGARGGGFRQYYYRNEKAGARLKPLSMSHENLPQAQAESGSVAPPVRRTLQRGTFGIADRNKYTGSIGHLGTRAPPAEILSPGLNSKVGYAKKFRIVHDREPAKSYDFMFQEHAHETFDWITQYVSDTLNQKLKRFFTLKNKEIKSLKELYRCNEDVLIATAKERITEATIKAVKDAIYNFKNTASNSSKNDSGFSDGPGLLDESAENTDLDPTPRHKLIPVPPPKKIHKSPSPTRKQAGGSPDRGQRAAVVEERPSEKQLARVYQRKKERDRKEKEKLAHEQLNKAEEERRQRRQQARMEGEKQRRLKRIQFDPTTTNDGGGTAPTRSEIQTSERAEAMRRRKEKASLAQRANKGKGDVIFSHDEQDPSSQTQFQARRQKVNKENEKDRMERELKDLQLAETSERLRRENEKDEQNNGALTEVGNFEEANFIRKKKQEPKGLLLVDQEAKILKDAEESEKERLRATQKSREDEKRQLVFQLEDEVDRSRVEAEGRENERKAELELEAAEKERRREDEEKERQEKEIQEKERAEKERQEREEQERLKAEEAEKARLAAERAETRRVAEEEAEKERLAAEEQKRLEEAENARKAAALEEAARLRKAEEERQKAAEIAEEEAAEKHRKAAEAENERIEAERRRKEDEEKRRKEKEREDERKRKEAEEKAEAERKRKAAEEKAKQEAEVAKKAAEKEKVRPNGLISPIYDEEEITRRYELKKKMGDGNFANVYQALLKSGDPPAGAPEKMREFAVKQIDKSKVVGSRKNNSSKVQMLKNEIEIMKTCNHPNIAKLYESYETEKHVYLVMELVKGGDLFDAISENIKFEESQASLIIRHLAEALDYLHSRKIVHRDIKPENILVEKDEKGRVTHVKLGDFGLAMHVKEKIYSVCGTPTYVAPEILAETGYGLEVDNWATGVISYILLCGFPPFRSIERNQDELFDTIQRGEFEYLSPYWDHISDTAKDLIDQLLVVEIRKRMKSKDVLKHKFILTHNTTAKA